jgi:flagellar P-ring protein precursor FlgI
VRLALRNADFTTAKRIAAAINDFIGANTAEPLDQSTVQVNVPKQYAGNVVSLLTEIEQLQIEPDLAARFVIDERSGIIVMGRDVRVSTVAVAQGNLTSRFPRRRKAPASAVLARPDPRCATHQIGVQEDGKKFAVVREGVSLQQLVDGLNAPARAT